MYILLKLAHNPCYIIGRGAAGHGATAPPLGAWQHQATQPTGRDPSCHLREVHAESFLDARVSGTS